MEDFFKQLLLKILSSIIFIALMFLVSLSVMTGEFPPKKNSIKAQYEKIQELKQSYTQIMQKMSATSTPPQISPTDALLEQQIKDIRTDQLRLQSQLSLIIEQNKLILLKMKP